MTERDVATSLGSVHTRVSGHGPGMLMWPSLLLDGTMFDALAARLSATHRVVVIDPPGQGRSAPLEAAFDFETCARVVVELLDTFGIERVRYIGNSWGAMAGGTFAARYPERVAYAVLSNGTASRAPAMQKLEMRALVRVALAMGGIHPLLRGQAIAKFAGPTSRRERPLVIAAIGEALSRIDMHSVRHGIESVVVNRPDQHALFSTIRVPVLVIAGAEDITFPHAESSAMAAAIPRSEYVELRGAAHLAALECPNAVADIIERFAASRLAAH